MPGAEAWNARQNLLEAANLIISACANAERSEEVYDRIGEFNWQGIRVPLDEMANELRQAAEFIVAQDGWPKWQTVPHCCGYAAWHGEKENCFHETCWKGSEAIVKAIRHQDKARSLLGEWEHEDEPTQPQDEPIQPDDYDRGYDAAMSDLQHWVDMWLNYQTQPLGEGNMEEHERCASVTQSGGKFEDFIVRELFFYEEGKA